QVFVFGAVTVNARHATYIKWAGDLERLKALPNYLGLMRFSTPPELSNLDGFAIGAEDLKDLKKCKPDDCEIQLPSENIEAFRNQIDWSSPDPAAQVNDLARKMALDRVFHPCAPGSDG